MVKTMLEVSETWRHVEAMRNPTQMFFLSIAFQKR